MFDKAGLNTPEPLEDKTWLDFKNPSKINKHLPYSNTRKYIYINKVWLLAP